MTLSIKAVNCPDKKGEGHCDRRELKKNSNYMLSLIIFRTVIQSEEYGRWPS